jgi:hypothetical protein
MLALDRIGEQVEYCFAHSVFHWPSAGVAGIRQRAPPMFAADDPQFSRRSRCCWIVSAAGAGMSFGHGTCFGINGGLKAAEDTGSRGLTGNGEYANLMRWTAAGNEPRLRLPRIETRAAPRPSARPSLTESEQCPSFVVGYWESLSP